MVADSEVEEQLYTACRDGDAARVSQLFANHSLDADNASAALGDLNKLDPAIVRILLQNGADVNEVSTRMIPHSNAPEKLLELLVDYGYDIKSDGHRILQDFSRNRKTIDWLLDQGVDINRTDSQRLDNGFNLANGETDSSLHLLNKVAADGDIDLFDHLVSRGANTALCTALHSASRCTDAQRSKTMICHLLDKHTMDIDRNNDDLRDLMHDSQDHGSPLCSAIIHQNLTVVHELLKRGARVDDPEWSPVSYAVRAGGCLPALEPLLRAGANATEALTKSVLKRNIDAAKLCLQFGADPAPALDVAIEEEEDRLNRIAEDDAYFESEPDSGYEKSEKEIEKERVEEWASKLMIEMLKSATHLHN